MKFSTLALIALTLCFASYVCAAEDWNKFIQDTTQANEVVVFSKSYCPFCRRAKAALDQAGIRYKAVELDLHPNGGAIQAALLDMTLQRTVPNVWIKNTFVGGSDALQAKLKDGTVHKLLGRAAGHDEL